MEGPSLWLRPRCRPPGAKASVTFLAFWSEPPSESEGEAASAFHPFEDEPEEIEINHLEWADEDARELAKGLRDAETFEGLDLALQAALEEARFVEQIEVIADPAPTLGHLQIAWGIVLDMIDRGAVAVKDLDAQRWWLPRDLRALTPTQPFDLGREITLGFTSLEDGLEVFVNGMEKFGAPALVMRVPDDADGRAFAAEWLSFAAGLAAEGEPLDVGDLHAHERAVLHVAAAETDESGVERRWVRVSAVPDERSLVASRGDVPEWVQRVVGLTPFPISEEERASVRPGGERRFASCFTATAVDDPGVCIARIIEAFEARGFGKIERDALAHDVIIAGIERESGLLGRLSREGPRAAVVVAARSFPATAAGSLVHRVGKERTFVSIELDG